MKDKCMKLILALTFYSLFIAANIVLGHAWAALMLDPGNGLAWNVCGLVLLLDLTGGAVIALVTRE